MKLADEERELTRLLAEEPSAFGSSLATLRSNLPDAAELASLASRLELQGLNVSTQAAARPTSSWKKWVLGGGGGALLAAWLAWHGPHPAHDRGLSDAQAPAGSPAAAAELKAEAALPPRDGPSRAPSTAASALGGLAPPGPIVAPMTAALPPPSVEAPAPTSAVVPPSPRTAGGAVNDSPSRNANVSAASPGATSPASTAPAGSAPSPVSPAALPTEIELLRDARFALRAAPGRALELTDQHVRLFPQGKLAQERELLAISALVALGRRTAALSRAASFERSYPLSPYRKQVAELLK